MFSILSSIPSRENYGIKIILFCFQMVWRAVLWVVLLTAVACATEDDIHDETSKIIHRLVGGHLRVDETDLNAANSGAGKDKNIQKHKDDETKTLSQQVADGKYGLIQKELFSKPVKRPGVLSYEANPEVPKDNIKNLGGLQKNEIWLAENHLLVLKGGNFPAHDNRHEDNQQSLWPPIDDYNAPQRQVKIPSHPKVPPPFPVQLEEGGPLQLLGTNNSRTFNGTIDETAFAVPPPEGYVPGTGPYFPPLYQYPANATAGETPYPNAPYPPTNPGEYHPGDGPAPFPIPLNGTLPPYFASLPPGAAILPPPDNQTDIYDDDDPSIFYPPPYSFFYPKDNSTEVPPGPLVPGIILPPPPNFFAPLEEKKKPQKPLRTKKPQTTTTDATKQIRPTTTPLPPTSIINQVPYKKITYLPSDINNELNPTTPPVVVTILPVKYKTTTSPPPTTTQQPVQRKKQPSVTILKPVNQPSPIYYNENEVSSGKPFAVYGPPVNTTQIPIKIYYSTTSEISAKSPRVYNGISTKLLPKTTTKSPPSQYYYYEDSTQKPMKPSLPDPYIQPQPAPQIFYVTSKPHTTQRPRFRLLEQTTKPDTFKIHIARLRQQLQSFITPKPYFNARRPQTPNNPRPVYQYSFQSANYPNQQQYNRVPKYQNEPSDSFKPLPKYSVQIQPAVEIIPNQQQIYQNTPTPSPGYYQKYQVSSERPSQSQYYSTSSGRPDYDYEDVPQGFVPQQKPQYVKPVEQYRTTPRPIAQYSYEATPNPIYQNYYTKNDEKYMDDITKTYFTVFGKKLPAGGTTPLPPIQSTTSNPIKQQRPVYVPNEQIQYQKPISLESDTLVNYAHPRPNINPDAEYIQIDDSNQKEKKPEIVQAISVPSDQQNNHNSYISYQLPGDEGAHFYFLTPQLVKRTDQGAGYYYSQANASPRKKRSQEER